jgi:hypothetical protein
MIFLYGSTSGASGLEVLEIKENLKVQPYKCLAVNSIQMAATVQALLRS